MLLYQSPVWRQINEDIYGRNVWWINWRNEQKWGITKTKKVGTLNLNSYHLWGIEGGITTDRGEKEFQQNLAYLRQKILGNWKDIYLQIGLVDEIGRCPSVLIRKNKGCDALKETKKKYAAQLIKKGLKKSFVENMPEATVEIDLTRSLQELLKDISATSKRYIKKYDKYNLKFQTVQEEADIHKFWELWSEMASSKGIGVWDQQKFKALINLLQSHQKGGLFLAKTPNGEIAFGGVMVFLDDRVVYLYGALNPAYGGSSYWMMWQFMLWAKQKGFEIFDLLGVKSINSSPAHSWAEISRFKYSLGGEHVEYIGNFDIVHNAVLYQTFKTTKLVTKNLKHNLKQKDGNKSRKKSKS